MTCSVCRSQPSLRVSRCSTCYRYWLRHDKAKDRPLRLRQRLSGRLSDAVMVTNAEALELQLFAAWARPLLEGISEV